MDNLFEIEKEKLEEAKEEIDMKLEEAGFYELFKDTNKKGATLPNVKEGACIDALVNGLGVYQALREELSSAYGEDSFGKETLDNDGEFLNIFSMYAGAAEALETIKNYGGEVSKYGSELKLGYDQLHTIVGNEVIDKYMFGLKNARNHNKMKKPDEMLAHMSQYFKAILNGCEELKQEERFHELEQKIASMPIKVNSLTLTGFDYGDKKEGDGLEQTITYDEVIGNQEGKDFLRQTLKKLFQYNPETKSNPVCDVIEVPRTTLFFAKPGTGKTTLIQAGLNHAEKLAKETGIPLTVRTLSQSEESRWVGGTAENLDNSYASVIDPKGVGIWIIEDIDGVIGNRANEGTQEHKKDMLQHLLNKLEGVNSKYNGNYIIISSTNRANDMDTALKGRVAQKQIPVPGPESADEFGGLVKLKLKQGIDWGYVKISDKEKLEIGEACLKEDYSGRDIRNVTVSILDQAATFDIPDEIIPLAKGDPETYKQKIADLCQKFTGKDVIKGLQKYRADNILQDKLARDEFIKNRKTKIIDDMLVQEQAQKDFPVVRKQTMDLTGNSCLLSQEEIEATKAQILEDKIKGEMINMLKGTIEEELANEDIEGQARKRLEAMGYDCTPEKKGKKKPSKKSK